MDELRAELERDPLVATAQLLMDANLLTRDEVLDRYETTRREIGEMAEEAAQQEGLRSAQDVMGPIRPHSPAKVAEELQRPVAPEDRKAFWGARLPESAGPLPISGHINRCLGDLLVKYPEVTLFGEDVARKGGVYGVTRGLLKRAGGVRVYDTLLDEQTILGLAIGAAQVGCIPIPEIQYLAYLHNAEDQILSLIHI